MDLKKGSLLNAIISSKLLLLLFLSLRDARACLSLVDPFLPAVRSETSGLLMIFILQNDHLITWTYIKYSWMLIWHLNSHVSKFIAAGTPWVHAIFLVNQVPLPACLIQSPLITSLLLLRDSDYTTTSSTERGHLKGGQHLLTGLICSRNFDGDIGRVVLPLLDEPDKKHCMCLGWRNSKVNYIKVLLAPFKLLPSHHFQNSLGRGVAGPRIEQRPNSLFPSSPFLLCSVVRPALFLKWAEICYTPLLAPTSVRPFVLAHSQAHPSEMDMWN